MIALSCLLLAALASPPPSDDVAARPMGPPPTEDMPSSVAPLAPLPDRTPSVPDELRGADHRPEPPAHPLHLRATEAGAPRKPLLRVAALTDAAAREYDAGLLDEALENAQTAYTIQPSPDLLYDLGLIHLALHHFEMAAFSFRAYLAASPRARDRPAVEGLIIQMDEANRATPSAAQTNPADSATPGAAPTESLDPLPIPFADPACSGPTPTVLPDH